MPQVLTEAIARPPLGGSFLGYIDKLLRDFARSLELRRPVELEQTAHWFVLVTIVCGAAVVRFWGLGNVGLHGDEETMAMAVRGILQQGIPVLPSGMFYPRGLSQLYLMAASVSVFGESEWALRLPSALCGVVLVPIGFVLGRRFLRPNWNLAFAASLAFVPELILYSQTARMYIFLVTCIAGSMACIFAWERTGRVRWLWGAIALLIPGLEMHALAVASVLMFLFPGLVQGDLRKLGAALVAIVTVFVAYVLIDGFVNAQYPVPPADFVAKLGVKLAKGAAIAPTFALSVKLLLGVAGAVFAYVGVRVARAVTPIGMSVFVACLLLAGIALQLALFYHLAVLSYAAGAVFAIRHGALQQRNICVIFAAGVAAIALFHVLLLATTAGTFVRLVGALIGQPSIWPYARIAEFSLVAGVLCGLLLLWGLFRFANNRRVPDFWLLAALGTWAPVFALGLFAWNVPSRYTSVALIPLLVCAFAFAQITIDRIAHGARARIPIALERIVVVLAAIAVINPTAAAATVNSGYEAHPDHKGAAEFMRTQAITDRDIVLAEDVLEQTYYLGHVDYWLIGPEVARRFVMKSAAGIVDFYTGTPVIVTTAMLDELLANNRDKRVFIIGTGEGWSRGRRAVRGELQAAIESNRFETLYVGRDGRTQVLRAVPAPVADPAPVTDESGEERPTAKEQSKAAAEALDLPVAPDTRK